MAKFSCEDQVNLGLESSADIDLKKVVKAINDANMTPAPGNTSSAGNIVLTVDTAAMRPVSLRYDYDGEQVQVSVLGIKARPLRI